MMFLERSSQEVPRTAHTDEVGFSRPLHDLAEAAPPVLPHYNLVLVDHPFSNDDSASYFEQTLARANTPEFQEASNRVAVLVGESALMASLPLIPEETIILLDKSPDMTSYLSRYVAALRNSSHIGEWAEKAGIINIQDPEQVRATDELALLAGDWIGQGYSHPAMDVEYFKKSRELACEKAIIPWTADMASPADMQRLGEALRQRNANVTMVNMTNLLDVYNGHTPAEKFVDGLDQLPVTANAPILTTNTMPKFMGSRITEATGPFFGVNNLRQNLDAALDRRYLDLAVDTNFPQDMKGLVAGILDKIQRMAGGPKPPKGFTMEGVLILGDTGFEEVPIDELPADVQSALRRMTD